MKHLRNHAGLTLIELLASLALLSIVITIGGSLLMQGFLSSSKVHNEINLNQQANMILSILREEASEKSVNICLLSNGDLLMDGKSLMTKEQLTIHELYIETINSSSPNLNDLSIGPSLSDDSNGQCFQTSISKPTFIKLSIGLIGDPDHSYITSTIISKRPGYEASPKNPVENDQENKAFISLQEFEAITPGNDSEFTLDFPDGSENYCELTGNIKLNRSKVFAPTWGTLCPITTFHGSLWGPYSLTLFSEISVDGDFYMDQGAVFEENASLRVNGNGYIANETVIKADANVNFFNGFIKDKLTVQENATLTTHGSLRVDGTLLMTGKSQIKSGGYVYLQGPVKLYNNTSILVEGPLIISDSVQLQSDAMIASHESLTFHGDVSTQSSVQILSGGDITFNKGVGPESSRAIICAEGNIYGVENIEENHRIKVHQPEGACTATVQ